MTSGNVVSTALVFAAVLATQACAQQIAIWQAPVPDEMLAASPTALAQALAAQGYDTQSVATDDLLDPARLSAQEVGLLVIPTIGAYPSEAIPVLEEYLKAGGSFLSLGGFPFDRPLAKVGEQWQCASLPDSPPGQVQVIANFEDEVPRQIRLSGGTEGERMLWERVPGEQGEGRCLRVTVDDLKQWEYVGFPLHDTGDATFTMLHFRARADENTPLLGMEMNEDDNSRWKMVLPLSTEWRDYNIFLPNFLSYATEGRGGPGDYLHPERLTGCLFGYTLKMVGPGPHTLYLDDIQRWQFVPPDPQAIALSRSIVNATARYYGKAVKVPEDDMPALLRLLTSAGRFERASLRGTGEAGVCAAEVTVPGTHDGWLVSVPVDDGPAYRNVAMSKRRIARVVPLLVAREDETDLGPPAVAVAHYGGDLAGGSWACFALENTDILGEPTLKDAVLSTVDYLVKRPRIVSLSPTFGVEDGRAQMALKATIRTPRAEPGSLKVRLMVETIDGTTTLAQADTELTEPPGTTTEALLTVGAEDFDASLYRATAETWVGDGPVDREEFTVNTWGVMGRLCDFFLAAQQEDGVISGAGCVDQRAARGLLAMYEMSGEEKFRDAAIRWGDMELREQREDGGYRMGYGITEAGEACYVADGGEIAIGIERLLKYVPAERRQAYVDSLRRYFQHREDFRLEDGTIAVGWVFSKRYTQEGGDERSETPLRSDKSFGFVVGCTLASAAALHHITGRPEDREMAIRDAQWFLDDNLKATSVFGEAAQWAHYFLDDDAMGLAFAARMKDSLLPTVAKPSGWWYTAGGRSGVTLGALYYYSHLDPSPEVLAGLMRGLYYTVGDKSPSGLLKVMAEGSRNADEWKYLCYSSVSLAEVLRPLVTMRDIAGG